MPVPRSPYGRPVVSMEPSMFEAIRSVLSQSVEYQNWGLNALTISALGTAFFTFVEGWGNLAQILTIFRKKSGESVSTNFFIYITAAFSLYLFYGVHTRSLSVTFNGVIFLLHPPILYGLWRYKGFTKDNWAMVGLGVTLNLLFVFTPYKTEVFGIMNVGVVFFLSQMPYEIWKAGTRGAADIKMIAAYMTSTVFWVGYAFATADPILRISTPLNLFFLTTAAVLWYRSEEDPALSSAT